MSNSIWRLLTAQPTALQLCEWEAAVPAEAQGKNPYRAEEVALTLTARHGNGTIFTVPGFCYEPYCITDETVLSLENMPPTFRFRVAFPFDGTWHIEMTIAVDGTVYNVSADTVTVAQATEASPLLAVEPVKRQVFVTADGAPVLLSGLNFSGNGGLSGGAFVAAVTDAMRQQRVHGGNYVYLCAGSSTPELHADAVTRRQDVAAVWDALFDAAETTGTYLQMGLFTRNELWYGYGQSVWASLQAEAADFFDDEACRAAVQDYLRYVVARWGYSHRLISWDLVNGLDCNMAMHQGRVAVVPRWAADMVACLRSLDGVHPVSTGVFFPSSFHVLYEPFDVISLAQSCYYGVGHLADLQQFVNRTFRRLPLLVESGLQGTTASVAGGDFPEDLSAYHLQNWAGLMGGGAGTAMSPSWKDVMRLNATRELPALLNFAKEIPWADPQRTTLTTGVTLSHGRMGVQGYRGADYAYLWLFDLRFLPMERRDAMTFTEAWASFAMPAGAYRVRCVDTRTGDTVQEETVVCDGTLQVTLPAWSKDIAVAVTKEEAV